MLKLKKPTRKFHIVIHYLIPKRLTLNCNPPIYAWLWWNFELKGKYESLSLR
jgi:hypothetical protein